jgi:uncharacterized membrane protein
LIIVFGVYLARLVLLSVEVYDKLATLTEAKTLGGVGSILVLLTALPTIGWILGIVGLVMVLVAIKYVSDAVSDPKIFNNMLVSIVLTIGAVIVGGLVVAGTVFRVMGMGTFVGSSFVPSANITTGDWVGLAGAIIGGLAVVWGFLVASAVFLRRSYNNIAAKTNVKMFGTTGLIYLIGAATAIIGIGFVLILVAEILQAVSFFEIQETSTQYTAPTLPVMTPSQ